MSQPPKLRLAPLSNTTSSKTPTPTFASSATAAKTASIISFRMPSSNNNNNTSFTTPPSWSPSPSPMSSWTPQSMPAHTTTPNLSPSPSPMPSWTPHPMPTQFSTSTPPSTPSSPIVPLPSYSHTPVPSTPQTQAAHKREEQAHAKADEFAKKTKNLESFIRELTEIPLIANAIPRLQQLLGEDEYTQICKQVALILNKSENKNEGEEYLKKNYKILLSLKDENGYNIFEKSIRELSKKAQLQNAVGSLYQMQKLLTQAQSCNGPQKIALESQAKAVFESLDNTLKAELCGRLWVLDGAPEGIADYGYKQAIENMQKLIAYKDTHPLDEAIQSTLFSISKPIDFKASYLNSITIELNDSKDAIQIIQDLNQLEDLRKLLLDSTKNPDFLREKVSALKPSLRDLIFKLIWIASYKPSELGYSDRIVWENVRSLVTTFKDTNGNDLLSRLMTHQRELLKAQRRIDELNFYQLGKLSFVTLTPETQEMLKFKLWCEDGRKDEHGYADRKISENPNCIFNQGIFAMCLSDLQNKVKTATDMMLKDFDNKFTLPNGPIDVNSDHLFSEPGLNLPAHARVAVLTAEFAGVASVGGLAPAVEGMVRGFDLKTRVIMPLYYDTNGKGPIPKKLLDTKKEKPEYAAEHNGQICKVFKVYVNGIRVYLIDHPDLFRIPAKADGTAGNLYTSDWNHGWEHPRRRFAVFQSLGEQVLSRMSGIVELRGNKQKKRNPINIAHYQDPQMGLGPKLMRHRHPGEETPATVFTFHNNQTRDNAYDQDESAAILAEIGLPNRKMNPFIEALSDAEMVTTVSHTFASEAQEEILGNGVQHAVKTAAFQGKLVSILNGCNNSCDPSQDEQLKNHQLNGKKIDLSYGPDTPNLAQIITTAQYELCDHLKTRLDEAYAKLNPRLPIVAFWGRFDSSQKGIDKLPLIMDEVLANGGQFVCIGIEPDEEARKILNIMKQRAHERGKEGVLILEDNRDENGKLKYQGVFGSLLRTAMAFPIVPSKYEPFGFIPPEANRHGKKVIATQTGGMNDMVKTEGPNANGYLFKRYPDWHSSQQNEAIKSTIRIALKEAKDMTDALHNGPNDKREHYINQMRRIMRHAMNWTWEKTPDGSPHAIDRLERVYAKALINRKKRGHIPIDKLKIFQLDAAIGS